METEATQIQSPMDSSPRLLADEISTQLKELQAQAYKYKDELARAKAEINELVNVINADIVSNEWNADSKITLGDLDEYLQTVFGVSLTFLTEYAATVEFKVRAVVKFFAEDKDAARNIADSIELRVNDDDVAYEGDAEVSEVYVDDTSIQSVREE